MDATATLPSGEASALASKHLLSTPGWAADLAAAVAVGPLAFNPAVWMLAGLAVISCAASVVVLVRWKRRDLTPTGVLGSIVSVDQSACPRRMRRNRHGAGSTCEPELARCERADVSLAVLIAVLGDPTAVADANPVLRALGARIRRVTLIRPVEAEPWDKGWHPSEEEAMRVLSRAALFVSAPTLHVAAVPGQGETAIARYAATQPVGVVVLTGDTDAEPELYRSPDVWNCTIVVVPAGGPVEP